MEPVLYNCDICDKSRLTEDEMRNHMLMCHMETSSVCPFCDLSDITPEEMNVHINYHLDSMGQTPHKVKSANDSQRSTLPLERISDSNMNSDNHKTMSCDSLKDKLKASEVCNNLSPEDHFSLLSKRNRKFLCNNEIEKDNSDNTQNRENERLCKDFQGNQPSISANYKKYRLNSSELTAAAGTSHEPEKMDVSFNCPICSFITDCTETLNVHVNQAHFRDTPVKQTSSTSCKARGPAHVDENIERPGKSSNLSERISETVKVGHKKPVNLESATGVLHCPFCDLEVNEDLSLQFHINGCHSDEAICSSQGSNEAPECPVCGEVFEPEKQQLLNAHVDSHFSGSEIVSKDSLFAQELQRREQHAQKYQSEKSKKPTNKPSTSNSSESYRNKPSASNSSESYRNKPSASNSSESYKNKPSRSNSSESYRNKPSASNSSESYRRNSEKNLEKAVVNGQMTVSDFHNHKHQVVHSIKTGVDEGTSCTKGIIPNLEGFYAQTGGYRRNQWLAAPTNHYSASYGDKGWGCGYRNFQMLLSSLAGMPIYQEVLFNGILNIPSIPKLQQLIEDAWSQGFDPQGREQLCYVVGSSKWIGATEICATLSSLRVKCQLVDFHRPTGEGGTHPRLFQWVKEYFNDVTTRKPPLYLQHQGHSRTIIGLEEYKDGSLKLLIFDPSTSKTQMMKFLEPINNNTMKTLRRTVYGLKAQQYQIVAVKGIMSEDEKKKYKLLKSDRVP